MGEARKSMSNEKPLIYLFEENELNVSRLYQLYAEKFPEYEIFWRRLSEEEIGHAEKIRSLREKPGANFAENKFTRGIVSYVMNFVKGEIAKAESGKISPVDALNTALRIEQSILEKKCFDFFQSSDKTLNEVMGELGGETQKHLKMLQNQIVKIEKKSRVDFLTPIK